MPTSNSRREAPDRNLAMELVRVTEAAAMAAGRWVGRGDKNGGDGAAVDAMRQANGDVIVLGVAGKMGPSLARMARRAMDAAGHRHRVIGVSRFSSPDQQQALEAVGVETIRCDLLDEAALARLPDALFRLPALEKLDLRWTGLDPTPAQLADARDRGCVVRT